MAQRPATCPQCRAKIALGGSYCPRCGRKLENPSGFEQLEIGAPPCFWRRAGYLLFCAIVGGLVVLMMMRLGVSFALSAALVLFMAVYMTLVGYRTGKQLEQDNKGTDF